VLFRSLETNPILKNLYLPGNNLKDDDLLVLVEALKVNRSIETLDLGSNSFGPEGAKSIRKILQTNTSLLLLDLHNNKFRNKGISIIFDGLMETKTLEVMRLSKNGIGNRSAQKLSMLLKTNKSLFRFFLDENYFGKDEIESILFAFNQSETLATLDIKVHDWEEHELLDFTSSRNEKLRVEYSKLILFQYVSLKQSKSKAKNKESLRFDPMIAKALIFPMCYFAPEIYENYLKNTGLINIGNEFQNAVEYLGLL
jgi:hypothetical protein